MNKEVEEYIGQIKDLKEKDRKLKNKLKSLIKSYEERLKELEKEERKKYDIYNIPVSIIIQINLIQEFIKKLKSI